MGRAEVDTPEWASSAVGFQSHQRGAHTHQPKRTRDEDFLDVGRLQHGLHSRHRNSEYVPPYSAVRTMVKGLNATEVMQFGAPYVPCSLREARVWFEFRFPTKDDENIAISVPLRELIYPSDFLSPYHLSTILKEWICACLVLCRRIGR
jgi:hypothetical protein